MIVVASRSAERRRRWRLGVREGGVREVRDWRQVLRTAREFRPSVIVLDLTLSSATPAASIAAIRRASSATRIIAMTAEPSDREALDMLRAGVRGYCHADIDPALVAKAIEVVQKGEIWATRNLVARLVEELSVRAASRNGAGPAQELGQLTPREREIALLVGSGAANKEIASRIGVTERTVKAHLTAVFRKLGVSDRLRLALLLNAPATERSSLD